MELVVGLFILIVILGALAGAKSFGGTIRAGCGCLLTLAVFAIAIVMVVTSRG
jgi:hypothetical protein